MDPSRGNAANGGLFQRLRSQAVESFTGRRICNLKGLKPESVTDCHRYLSDGPGQIAGEIRDNLFNATSGTIRVPHTESYFLYSFTMGINNLAPMLSAPENRSKGLTPPPCDILARRIQVLGPSWLAMAVDKEMPSVMAVFSDFQNNIIGPVARISTDAPRLLADTIAGSFLWAYVGGVQWVREMALEVCGTLCKLNGPPNRDGRHLCEMKKSTQLIPYSDLGRLCTLVSTFSKDFRTLA